MACVEQQERQGDREELKVVTPPYAVSLLTKESQAAYRLFMYMKAKNKEVKALKKYEKCDEIQPRVKIHESLRSDEVKWEKERLKLVAIENEITEHIEQPR